ncbi:XRE family transcriptional regulator, partial [Listeria monocytogenes]|nr:XRE family transcriptional regulator [Listeria monocytogenes]HCJ4336680.1 helix-turn-helix transcriptional regulator [Listeria innocua]
MELNKFVGNKIKQYREERGLNQEALAEKLHTTRQTISRYE